MSTWNKLTLAALAASLLSVSCKDSFLLYDTSQQDRLYFMEANQKHTASFSLIPEDEIVLTPSVYLMGMPADADRSFDVEYLEAAPGEQFTIGSVTYPVVTARPGVDFEVQDAVMPAGATSTPLRIVLKRTQRMKEGSLVKVSLRLAPNADFLVAAPDSSRVSSILTPYFVAYVSDGDPACPSWWKDGDRSLGWHFNLGQFYPEKFRLMLSYFHETQTTNPTFFKWASAAYGYNLDSPDLAYYGGAKGEDEDREADMMNVFWRKRYSSAWARYVFIPLYEYYKAYYAAHPDDPHVERMDGVNRNALIGWADPMDSGYGFFN